MNYLIKKEQNWYCFVCYESAVTRRQKMSSFTFLLKKSLIIPKMTTKKTTIMFGSSRDYNGFVGHSLLGVSYLRKLQDGLKKGRSIFSASSSFAYNCRVERYSTICCHVFKHLIFSLHSFYGSWIDYTRNYPSSSSHFSGKSHCWWSLTLSIDCLISN